MSTVESSQLLRAGLLEEVSVVLASAGADTGRPGASSERAPSALAATVGSACRGLGARVSHLALSVAEPPPLEEASLQEAVDGELAHAGPVDMLVVDASGPLVASLQAAWNVTHAVVNRAFLATQRGGRVVYLAPRPHASPNAHAACAGLENLARTLSIEWARHQITLVAVAPGSRTGDEQLGALVAYLASPAGAYFSGCLLDLRGAGGL
jgi:NAD(P)-dependent dehydrogenase (short-subunit alcohol dehydrogenase family)